LQDIAKNVEEVELFELEKIANYSTPNQVIGLFRKKQPISTFDWRNSCTLLLDDIQDPGNLGTIIRSADWFGVNNIVCSTHTVDIYNPKVVQSTMASLGRINVVYENLKEWLSDKRGKVPVLAAVLNGKYLHEINHTKGYILMIGNEGNGLSDELIQMCDVKITIPKIGLTESLNAAVATSIILYELHK
jgi:TrmH family RNA methyltransferase